MTGKLNYPYTIKRIYFKGRIRGHTFTVQIIGKAWNGGGLSRYELFTIFLYWYEFRC